MWNLANEILHVHIKKSNMFFISKIRLFLWPCDDKLMSTSQIIKYQHKIEQSDADDTGFVFVSLFRGRVKGLSNRLATAGRNLRTPIVIPIARIKRIQYNGLEHRSSYSWIQSIRQSVLALASIGNPQPWAQRIKQCLSVPLFNRTYRAAYLVNVIYKIMWCETNEGSILTTPDQQRYEMNPHGW